jgi:hypothetical protein
LGRCHHIYYGLPSNSMFLVRLLEFFKLVFLKLWFSLCAFRGFFDYDAGDEG